MSWKPTIRVKAQLKAVLSFEEEIEIEVPVGTAESVIDQALDQKAQQIVVAWINDNQGVDPGYTVIRLDHPRAGEVAFGMEEAQVSVMRPMQIHFAHPEAWGYPSGLDTAITRLMEQQGLHIVATNPSGQTVYVEPEYRLGGKLWCIFDNGGELCVEQPNTNAHYDVPLTSTWGMPADVEKYALLIVVWLLATIRGEPIDYRWRP